MLCHILTYGVLQLLTYLSARPGPLKNKTSPLKPEILVDANRGFLDGQPQPPIPVLSLNAVFMACGIAV